MTDRELWQAAWKEITLTTDSYPAYVKKGKPASSHFSKAKALGDQIGVSPPPPSGARVRGGVHFHGQWPNYTNTQRGKILDLIAASGLEWVRLDIEWRYIEQQAKGVYNTFEQGKVDYIADGCKARGLKLLGVICRTPDWANPNTGADGAGPPLNPADYGSFCNYAANRWPLAAIEVWNEQDPQQAFFSGTVAQYVDLLKAAYPAIKVIKPNTIVVSGGISSNDAGYITSLYMAGAKPYFDVLALHPYQQPSDFPPSTPNAPAARWNYLNYLNVQKVMASNNDGSKPVWFTEFGYSTHPNGGSEANWDRGVTEAKQAEYLVQAFDIAEGWPNVENVFVYKIDDEPVSLGRGPQLSNYGLLRTDLSAKPAYAALKARLA